MSQFYHVIVYDELQHLEIKPQLISTILTRCQIIGWPVINKSQWGMKSTMPWVIVYMSEPFGTLLCLYVRIFLKSVQIHLHPVHFITWLHFNLGHVTDWNHVIPNYITQLWAYSWTLCITPYGLAAKGKLTGNINSQIKMKIIRLVTSNHLGG